MSADTAALLARARRDVDDGTLPSVQLALARDGELIVDETFGAASPTRYVTFSVTKACTAALVWVLLGECRLSPGTRVAEVVPEFAEHGKDAVTVEHLLTHTAGFPRAPMRPEEGADPRRRVARMATWRMDWPAGSRTAYHATSAYWPLVEMAERLTGGVDFRTLFVQRLARPLGLPGLTLGAGPDDATVARISAVGRAAEGRSLGDHVAETAESFLLRFNTPAVRAVGVPGAGAVARAADIALFYQQLMHNGSGLFDPAVLDDATHHVRNHMVDPLFDAPANRTLGLVVAGDDGRQVVRGFGRGNSPAAFGAPGVGGQVAWADPATGLSFCYLTNGIQADVVAAFTRAAKVAGLAARSVSPAHPWR